MITNIYSADRCETGSRLLYFFSLLYLHSSTTTLPRLFLFSSCISNYASSSSASIPSAFSGCCFLTSSDSLSFLTAADSLSVPSSPSVRLRLRLQERVCFLFTWPWRLLSRISEQRGGLSAWKGLGFRVLVIIVLERINTHTHTKEGRRRRRTQWGGFVKL